MSLTLSEPKAEPTRDDWIKAVGRAKNDMYFAMDCNSVQSPHQEVLKVLENNPDLAQSKYGQRYLSRKSEIENLLLSRDHLDSALEDVLSSALTSASLKYWGAEK